MIISLYKDTTMGMFITRLPQYVICVHGHHCSISKAKIDNTVNIFTRGPGQTGVPDTTEVVLNEAPFTAIYIVSYVFPGAGSQERLESLMRGSKYSLLHTTTVRGNKIFTLCNVTSLSFRRQICPLIYLEITTGIPYNCCIPWPYKQRGKHASENSNSLPPPWYLYTHTMIHGNLRAVCKFYLWSREGNSSSIAVCPLQINREREGKK